MGLVISCRAMDDAAAPGWPALRRATLDDLPVILPLMVDFNRHEGIAWEPVSGAAPLRHLIDHPELGDVLLIGGGAGEVLGYAVVTWGYDLEYGGRDAVLTELYLVAAARGQGLGRRALQAIVAHAQRSGSGALHLQVRPDNAAGLRLYQSAGFAITPRHFMTRRLR